MINLLIDEIKKKDIESLISNKTTETKTLEYKEELFKSSDGDIKEFLADVSSFANASGGDIIYGIKEERDKKGKKTGRPESAIGIANTTGDEAKLRLENTIRDGLTPRVKVQIKSIDGFPHGPVIILRIPQSFSAPHMICKGASRFYSRNSAGKYPLDVGEIRSAFIASEALPEKIKRFREHRLGEITADQMPVQLESRKRLVIHLIPISAFLYGSNNNVVVSSQDDKIKVLESVSGSHSSRHNIDGYLTCGRENGGKYESYFQVYRNGIIEYVGCDVLTPSQSEDVIPSIYYEQEIIEMVSKYLRLMKYFNIEPPILIMVSLLAVKGLKMSLTQRESFFRFENSTGIDRDSIILPDVLVDDYAIQAEHILKSVFDAIWQSCGFAGSLNYDEQGNWNSNRH